MRKLTVCLTGGPCGGKSSALSVITKALENRGYKVLLVPEVATDLISSGICPSSELDNLNFQKLILEQQMSMEASRAAAAQFWENTVVVCDRGLCDQLAYIDKVEFGKLLDAKGMTLEQCHARYDCVIHLVTAADGAEEFYQWNDPSKPGCGNNAARSESPELARQKDKDTYNAWEGHPNHVIVDNKTDIDGKNAKVLKTILKALEGEEPRELRVKYLIKKPTKDALDMLKAFIRSEMKITQTYYRTNDVNQEMRVRKVSMNQGDRYFYAEKKMDLDGTIHKSERILSETEYYNYLADWNDNSVSLEKHRYCFKNNDGKYIELDVYDSFDTDKAMVEVEVSNMDEKNCITIPGFEIIKEVTTDSRYSNYTIAEQGL